jgi:predicted nucleic acid-binding protein
MVNYVIETSAWVEYFAGTKLGEKCKELIEKEQIATSIISIAELSDKAYRENQPIERYIEFILAKAKIIPLTIRIARLGAQAKNEIRKKKTKFGLADGIHLATAREQEAILLTKDNDFTELKKVIILR